MFCWLGCLLVGLLFVGGLVASSGNRRYCMMLWLGLLGLWL